MAASYARKSYCFTIKYDNKTLHMTTWFRREHFKDYADFCFQKFGDRVKIWGTINEPQVFVYLGKQMGFPSELKTEPYAPLIATHHIILAHSAAAKLYQEKYKTSQGGKIGISLPIEWSMPYDPNDLKDLAATEAKLDLQIG
ncbi:Non-cyanogenic beta-glucosidase, partial [Bienertia sinuspersici]